MTLNSGFLEFDPVTIEPTPSGSLAGKSFAAKDAIDVAGCVTGSGHPLWRQTHGVAKRSAWGVRRILSAGARLVGKTHTDELTYSLAGQNVHYGTPPNPVEPSRIPGGSSSGSASVVAAGHVDFALGTDCGGSVRIPASYCGLFGLRPTIDALATDGVCTLAQSFDTLGWFARDIATFKAVGQVLFSESELVSANRQPQGFRRITEAFASLDAEADDTFSSAVDRLMCVLEEDTSEVMLSARNCGFDRLLDTFRKVQGFEAWQAYRDWITEYRPDFGPGVAERFAAAAAVTETEYNAACKALHEIRATLHSLVTSECFLCLPTVPGPAPLVNTSESDIDRYRQLTLALTAIAGVGGLPQITMPLADLHGAPIGLSLIGPPHSDLELIEVASAIVDR